MKILITGGHFSPAYAFIKEIKNNHEVVLVGRKFAFEGDSTLSYEYEVCARENIRFISLTAGRVQRKLTRYTIPSVLKIPKGLYEAGKILKKEKPDVVLSFGGYLAFPVVVGARIRSIPVVLHEQTLHGGAANKFLSRFADIVCVSYRESEKSFPKKTVVFTGLPIRSEVFETIKTRKIPAGKKVIYVTGGSSGAHAINQMIEVNLERLVLNYIVIHQTGDTDVYKDYEKMIKRKNSLPKDLQSSYIVEKYIYPEEIGWVYKESEIIISRSGANTVAELIALSKKAILIPLPGGQSGEQLANAEYFVKNGTGLILIQDEINSERLFSSIEVLSKVQNEKNEQDKLATKKLLDVISETYEKKKHKKKD